MSGLNINKTRISVVTKPTNVSVSSVGIQGKAGETQDLSNYAVLNGGNNFTGVQNIIGAVTTTGSLFVSGSTVQIGNNTLVGRTELSGSITISGSTEFGGDLVPLYARGATLGTLQRPFRDIFLQSASINIASDILGGRNATISNTDGNVTIQAAGFQLKSASFVSFQVSEAGLTTIKTPKQILGTESAINIIGSNSGYQQPRTFSGSLLQMTAQDGQSARISIDTFGTGVYGLIAARTARGTVDVPTQTKSGDTLLRLTGLGWNNNNAFNQSIVRINLEANEDFTSTASGTKISFQTTPKGSISIQTSVQIDTDGLIVPNIPTNNTATQVLVWDSVSGRIGKQSGANNLDGGAAASVYLSVSEELNGGGA